MGDKDRKGDLEINIVDKTSQDSANVVDIGGGKYALRVTDEDSDGFTANDAYLPRTVIITSDVEITSGSTYDVLNYTGMGKCDCITLVVSNVSRAEVILTVDGTEIYRVNVELVKNRISDKEEGYMYSGIGMADFVDAYPTPFDFKSSLKVQVKAIGGILNINGAVVRYRIAG